MAKKEANEEMRRAPKRHFVVYVGTKMRRFVIPTSFLKNLIFQQWLDKATEANGFNNQNRFQLPCDESTFQKLTKSLGTKSSHGTSHWDCRGMSSLDEGNTFEARKDGETGWSFAISFSPRVVGIFLLIIHCSGYFGPRLPFKQKCLPSFGCLHLCTSLKSFAAAT